MIDLSISEIATIIQGKLFAPDGFSERKIKQVIIDSRSFFHGGDALFFALKGPRNDGHKYIPSLVKKGVHFFVVSEIEIVSPDAVYILADNTTLALQKMATHIRNRFHYKVIGITGSNGKTIVKEWLYELLSEEFKIVRSPKSYNSQIGVPLSVLLMDDYFNLAIFEAGISEPGEMEKLAAVIQPGTGILTNIGDAHQENFNSKREKIREKLKLFTNSKNLVFCADDEETALEVRSFCKANDVTPVSWSVKNRKTLIHFTHRQDNGSTTLDAKVNERSFRFSIPFTDGSSIENACHCFAAAWIMTENPDKVLPRFSNLVPVAMRLEIKKGINNCLLINDFYNSDLASFAIGLSVLHQQAEKSQLKKQVILSDIQQTGIPQKELYRQVSQLLKQWEINELTGIGPEISANSSLFPLQKSFFSSTGDFEKNYRPGQFKDSTILIKGARTFTFEKISALLQQKAHQTNLNVYRSLLKPSTKIMVMVKAFSYGSGDTEVAKVLQYQNVDYLAVAVADEGMELRRAGILTPIIVMNPEEQSFQNLIDYRLEPNLFSCELFENFEHAISQNSLRNFPVHLKLDTGMNRLGLKTNKEIEKILLRLKKSNSLQIKSVFSHLVASDDPALDAFTTEQISRFGELSRKIIAALNYKVEKHLLNSSGIERFSDYQMDMVRLGIGLYGISTTGLPLQNISTFKSVVSQVKKAVRGETVGYSRKGKVLRNTEIAVVPAGYADGIDRKLGNNNGEAFIKNTRVPIIGNICMDMLMLDVTGLNIQTGDEVEFFGPHISIAEVARKAGTIPYEILTGISQRVKRIYLYE
jgi:Alr-MurF fusion protein